MGDERQSLEVEVTGLHSKVEQLSRNIEGEMSLAQSNASQAQARIARDKDRTREVWANAERLSTELEAAEAEAGYLQQQVDEGLASEREKVERERESLKD